MHGLKTVRRRHHDALSRVDGHALERLLADHYRRAGWRVEHTGTGGTGARFDGGIDLKLWKDDQFVLVQSKGWNAYQVTHNDVHQLLGLMVNQCATGAILITTGEFTRYAIQSAHKLGHVTLIDGTQLRAMLGPLPELAPDATFSAAVRDVAATSPARARGRYARDDTREVRRLVAQLVSGVIGIAVTWVVVDAVLIHYQHTLSAIHPPTRTLVVPVPALRAPSLSTSATSSPPASSESPASNEQDAARARARSDAELAEWKRKNAESMKLLEKTTPEMK